MHFEKRYLNMEMKPPASPPSSYRGAALAARVRPAMRRGVLSRIPAFGLRRLLGRGGTPRIAAAPAAVESEEGRAGEGGADRPRGEWGGQGRELEEATRRLLVEVGGEFRDETVMAAEVSRGDEGGGGGGDGLVVEDVSSNAKANNVRGRKKKNLRDNEMAAEKARAVADEADGRKSRAELGAVVGWKGKKGAAKTPTALLSSSSPSPSKNTSARAKDENEQEAENPAEITRGLGAPRAQPLKGKAPVWLEEADLDWRGNPRTTRGKKQREKEEAAADDGVPAPPIEGEPAPTERASTIGASAAAAATSAPAKSPRAARSGSATAFPPPPPPPSESSSGAPTAIGAEGAAAAAATATVAAGAGSGAPAAKDRRRRTRSELLRERRAEVERRRAAALKERKKRGELSPQEPSGGALAALARAVRGYWGGARGRSRKASPEREGMIKSVCALSRPPPPQPPPPAPAADGG